MFVNSFFQNFHFIFSVDTRLYFPHLSRSNQKIFPSSLIALLKLPVQHKMPPLFYRLAMSFSAKWWRIFPSWGTATSPIESGHEQDEVHQTRIVSISWPQQYKRSFTEDSGRHPLHESLYYRIALSKTVILRVTKWMRDHPCVLLNFSEFLSFWANGKNLSCSFLTWLH